MRDSGLDSSSASHKEAMMTQDLSLDSKFDLLLKTTGENEKKRVGSYVLGGFEYQGRTPRGQHALLGSGRQGVCHGSHEEGILADRQSRVSGIPIGLAGSVPLMTCSQFNGHNAASPPRPSIALELTQRGPAVTSPPPPSHRRCLHPPPPSRRCATSALQPACLHLAAASNDIEPTSALMPPSHHLHLQPARLRLGASIPPAASVSIWQVSVSAGIGTTGDGRIASVHMAGRGESKGGYRKGVKPSFPVGSPCRRGEEDK
uniref:Uncharacterized protein n=1 Tax=Oryza sativa subsp. japonica TaxID=39947 RepID=Q6ESB2_ORYSJ|nr:hypothetical protein [Oryza sativa Japonica Group]